MGDLQNDGAWFEPKRFGYGAGRPIAWQGWAFMLCQISIIIGGTVWLAGHTVAILTWALIFALAPMPLYAAKTRGGWKWRWGDRD
ncbi:MAG: hypothetical protein JSR96_14440 [Proteobacteria bacterium]|nr:hypothetical protein [Pseudomonadota bacterium]